MESLGKQYGKPDLERLGIFSEMPYMNGKGYVSPFERLKYGKGKSMLAGGEKIKDGTSAAYFDKEFKRIFEGEAILRPKKKQAEPIMKPFLPPGGNKQHSSPGDYFGTFSGKIEAFSNVPKKQAATKRENANFLSNPVKFGGPGYANICINKYPEHYPDPYKPRKKAERALLGKPLVPIHWPQPYFTANPFKEDGAIGPTYLRPKEKNLSKNYGKWVPNGRLKMLGGGHHGCFNKFPLGIPDRYVSEFDANKRPATKGKYFYPQSMALKTKQTTSVLNQNTNRSMNVLNYETYKPNYIKYLVD